MKRRTLIGLTALAILIAAAGIALWQTAGRSEARQAQPVERDLFGAPVIAQEPPPAHTVPQSAESGLPWAGNVGPEPVESPQSGPFPGEPAKPFEMPEIKAYA